MWKTFSVRYIMSNKVSSFFLAVITFISSAFLSVIISIFYNIWVDYFSRQQITAPGSVTEIEPWLFAFAFVMILVCISLIAMIHNAFEVSMNARMHQMGILQSIGAAPKQIRTILLQEALTLCVIPVITGILLGVLLSFWFIQLTVYVGRAMPGYEVRFYYHFAIGLLTVILSMATVIISAWVPAHRLSKLTPMEAIHFGGELPVNKMKKFNPFSRFFGIYGELALKSLYSRKKLLKTSTLSLFFSYIALISFLNIETISRISTQNTFFYRYRDKWDIMLTLENTPAEGDLLKNIRMTEGVQSCILYKKVAGQTILSPDLLSEEVAGIGLEQLTDNIKQDQYGNYLLSTPVYVLDHESFGQYCIGNHLNPDGNAAAVNIVWDSINSNRRNRQYLPFLADTHPLSLEITNPDAQSSKSTGILITAFSEAMPDIREEFEQYSISLIVSENLYRNFSEQFSDPVNYYNIRIDPDADEAKIIAGIQSLLPGNQSYSLTGRAAAEASDENMRNALNFFIMTLASLIAFIGLSNVFSATLGQIHQRKREFSRYLSVGISPKGMKKIMLNEIFIISLRPLLISIFINIAITALALNAASITMHEFIKAAPFIPIISFAFVIFLFVALAYYLGGKKIYNNDEIAAILKDETML